MAPTSPETLAAKVALDRRNADGTAPASRATTSTPDSAQADIAASPNPGATVPAANTSGAATSYTVVKGDTLSSIAKKHSLQVSQLRAWNHLKNDSLQLGQVLRLSSN
jgi:phosphate transport system substrate-binding protein